MTRGERKVRSTHRYARRASRSLCLNSPYDPEVVASGPCWTLLLRKSLNLFPQLHIRRKRRTRKRGIPGWVYSIPDVTASEDMQRGQGSSHSGRGRSPTRGYCEFLAQLHHENSQTEALPPQPSSKPELKQASSAWISGLTKVRPSTENLRHSSECSANTVFDAASPADPSLGTLISYGVCKRTQDGKVGGSAARQVDNHSSLIS